MNLTENIKLALRAIKGNLLRTILTLTIIAIGITALVGILTAIDSIKAGIKENFAQMGANTFTIKNRGTIFNRDQTKENPVISYTEALEFKERFDYPSTVSVTTQVSWSTTVKNKSKKTNPNVSVQAVDENYLNVMGHNLILGRNFTRVEVANGSNVVLIGSDVAAKVFEPGDSIINQLISVGTNKYRITGLLAPKGASTVSNDNILLIPILNAKRNYAIDRRSIKINVEVPDAESLDHAISEAMGLMRSVRRLKVSEAENFEVSRSERLANELIDQVKKIVWGAIIIGAITLFGAGIGLMNIMLVSVNERTREIGISKAIGAKKSTIVTQFLTEAIVICQIGGFLGIVIGILMGNIVSLLLGSAFIIPWGWIIGGVAFCFVVGLLAGVYPAIKAGNLNPVEALRYE